MRPLTRYWLSPVPGVRPWLLLRATLFLFAFDLWSDHIGPAWRYGTAGFNVAHFAVLDALPIPSAAAYVGTLFFIGVAALVCALVPRAPRPLLGVIALGYAWSWSCSMHDSYQHHYLLSWVLLAFAFFPLVSSSDLWGSPSAISPRKTKPADTTGAGAKKSKKRDAAAGAPAAASSARGLPHGLVPRVSAYAYALVTSACAVVYSYTAWSKTDPDWRSGDALRNITHDGRSIEGAVELAASLGVTGDSFWWWMGHSVVGVQIAIALGYATAPMRDRASGGARIALDVIAWLALTQALAFHIGAEYRGLEVGWFSWYMVIFAIVVFAPASTLSILGLAVTMPIREVAEWMGRDREPSGVAVGVLAVVAAIALGAAGAYADLPGAPQAAIFAGMLLVLGSVLAAGQKRGLREVRAIAIAGGLAAIGMALALQLSQARYDFWRFAGGDFRRRGDYAAALDAYLHAERWAPEGESRSRQIEEMRRQLGGR